jgi:putative transposase
MARIKVQVGTRYVYANEVYVVRRLLAAHSYRVENVSAGEERVVSYDEIFQAWSSGDLRFEVVSPNAAHNVEVPLRTRYVDDDIADLPEEVRDEAWRRYDLVVSIYQHYDVKTIQMLSRRQIEQFAEAKGWQPAAQTKRSRVGDALSVSSIERYIQAFVDTGGDIRSLVPQTRRQGGKGQNRLDEAVERIIGTVLEKYASITVRESTVDQIVTDVVNQIADENRFRAAEEQLDLPHERTIRRRIKAAGETLILGRKLSRREQKAHEDMLPASRPGRILERVEIDHTTLDLFVVDERDGLPIGRPHITACIDKYSALVPGWHIGFRAGGYESIMLCLRHALLPKPNYRELYGTEHDYPVYGLFEKLCIDNGRDFKSADLREALAEIGIIREQMPKETPWFKGSIERYFRSVNQRLLKGTPGYSFGNVLQLGGYDAQKDAVISLSAFLEIFHVFMVDIYPYAWHKGIEGIPIQRWEQSWSLFRPDLFEDANALRIILLPSAERILQLRGIEWEWNFYRGPELARLRELYGKEKVRFKYDPDGMDLIYVRDNTSPTGWVEFHSTNPEYTRGLSLAKHQVIRQSVYEQQQAVDRYSLARAKAHIQQVIEREFYATKKLRRRSRLKPLLNPDIQPETAAKVEAAILPTAKADPPDDEEAYWQDMPGWSSDYDLPITGDNNP